MLDILNQIQKPNDIKNINQEDYPQLAEEIREYIVNTVSETGGHLASNLGAVELTMALHLCLDFPEDKIIWDVGHQSYTHKILTGRKDQFGGLRTYKGLSGFPKQKESDSDAFDTGHSSTSISAALGYAKARDIQNEKYNVVAVIGDGAMTGGMAYEALNNVARLDSNLIIILNDNKMSISENVGGLSKYLNDIRIKESYVDFKDDLENVLRRIPKIGDSVAVGMKRSKDSIKQLLVHNGFFDALGIDYMGPFDGHNIEQLVQGLKVAKRRKKPIILHVITKKGKGYRPAETSPSAFHGVGCFNVDTGEIQTSNAQSNTQVFSLALNHIAKDNPKIVAITAAMPDGTGLSKFAQRYPKRFFDVGIAEEHAVTFAAGLAAGGMKPYVAVYSSFLQRAYDQMIHDVCIQNLPVVFCVDRAGLVGADGETHQGIMDLSYLNTMPNMTIIAPKNKYELFDAIKFSENFQGPLAIRYGRGQAWDGLKEIRTAIEYGKSEWLVKGSEVAILAVGSMVETAMNVKNLLEKEGLNISVINPRFVKPLDQQLLNQLVEDQYKLVVTLEENLLIGGYGQTVAAWFENHHVNQVDVMNVGIDDVYVEQGNVNVLKEALGLDAPTVAQNIQKQYKGNR